MQTNPRYHGLRGSTFPYVLRLRQGQEWPLSSLRGQAVRLEFALERGLLFGFDLK